MRDTLAESDQLVDELIAADVLVIGTPLYNFGMPAALKAWIDQIVRPGRTVEVDESKLPDPYVPLLADRPRHAVIPAPAAHRLCPAGNGAQIIWAESGDGTTFAPDHPHPSDRVIEGRKPVARCWLPRWRARQVDAW